MKKKLLAVAMVCVLALGIGAVGIGFEPFAETPPGQNCAHVNGGPGLGSLPPPPWWWNLWP